MRVCTVGTVGYDIFFPIATSCMRAPFMHCLYVERGHVYVVCTMPERRPWLSWRVLKYLYYVVSLTSDVSDGKTGFRIDHTSRHLTDNPPASRTYE